MRPLLGVLPALLRQAEDSPEARESAAIAAWDAVAGDGVRRVCVPTRLFARRLLVATVDATWKTQLDRLASHLLFRMNSLLGGPIVTQIVFRIEPEVVRAARPESTCLTTENEVEASAARLANEAAAIDDPELRRVFLRAAGRCLARQKAADR